MQVCKECCAVEQGVYYDEDDVDQEYPICECCGMSEGITNYDEDYGQDR